MEMEGLVYSDFYRNTSEEIFMRTLMESSVGVPIPTMEMCGFKTLCNSFRADSEELFKNWLTTEENQGYASTSLVHNSPQQLSRMLADQVSLPSYQGSLEVGKLCGTHDTKAWFNSSQPMTRSRSSELRRKYVTMQNSQTLIGIEAMHTGSTLLINQLKHDFDIPNQSTDFISTSNSLSTNNDPHTDNVSSVVSILKDTLERKKHVKNIENYYSNSNQVHGLHLDDPVLIQGLQGAMDADMEGFVVPANLVQMNVGSREGSQSESSAAAPVFSTGLDVSNRQNNSGQSQSVCGSHKKLVANGKCRENRSVTKGTGDRGDPTKKRRVERSKKMAEAKEKTQTPATSSDIQSILNRCEILEKEVRSLKLNLAFMNRKDSEQTKQIEELQQQNEDMGDEKDRLLEEIERISSRQDKL
ncbi:protein CYCLOPS isoform X2 [Tanacetum coccineum]